MVLDLPDDFCTFYVIYSCFLHKTFYVPEPSWISMEYIVPNVDPARYADFDLVPRNPSWLEFPTVRQTT